jgi:hypothetical protein
MAFQSGHMPVAGLIRNQPQFNSVRRHHLPTFRLNTIRKMESRGDERVRVRTETLEFLTKALREAGVQFNGYEDSRAGSA